MFKPEWIRFSWDLKKLPAEEPKAGAGLEVRVGEEEESQAIAIVVERSYQAEQGWGVIRPQRMKELKDIILRRMDEKDIKILVLQDGRRLVGASVLCTAAESPRQLVSGVCVLEEYHCRGWGSLLLWRSLKFLADMGMEKASVVTRSNVNAHRYLYSKYGSTRERLEELPVLEKYV
jgi:N-acetylglutamate synthase-like GNAT family acetyltransferase